MTKIVYNACYGGFGLSRQAVMRYAELAGITLYPREEGSFTSYYLCPFEEYEAIQIEEANNPIGPGRFERSNSLYFSVSDIERNDPYLVQVVEELGDDASDSYAKLRIENIPTGTLYRIDEYDGLETVMTQESYDWKVA